MAKKKTAKKARALAVAKKTTGKNKGKGQGPEGQSKNDKGKKGQDPKHRMWIRGPEDTKTPHEARRLQSAIDHGIFLRVKRRPPPEGAGVVKQGEGSEEPSV